MPSRTGLLRVTRVAKRTPRRSSVRLLAAECGLHTRVRLHLLPRALSVRVVAVPSGIERRAGTNEHCYNLVVVFSSRFVFRVANPTVKCPIERRSIVAFVFDVDR